MKTIQSLETSAVKSTLVTEFDLEESFEDKPGMGWFVWHYYDSLKALYYAANAYISVDISAMESAKGPTVRDNISYRPERDDAVVQNIAKQISKARYSKTKEGFLISLPVLKRRVSVGGYINYDEREAAAKNLATAVVKKLGADFFDLTKRVETALKPGDVLRKYSGMDVSKDIVYEDPKSFSNLAAVVKSFRLVSEVEELDSSYHNADDPKMVDVVKLSDAGNKPDFMRFVLSHRSVQMYVDLLIKAEDAQYVTQTPFKEIRPVFIAQWMNNLANGDWSGEYDSVERIRPISSVVRANAPQQKLAKPRQGVDGLMLDEDGYLMFMPTMEASKEYEDYLESMGESDRGDFCFDPGMIYDETKREFKLKKPVKFPANRLIYTDWVNNKLAYTDTSGSLKIFDLQACIPAKIASVRALLTRPMFRSDASGKNLLSVIIMFGRRLIDNGIDPSTLVEDSDWAGWTPDEFSMTVEDLKQLLKEGSFSAYVTNIRDYVQYIWRIRDRGEIKDKDGTPILKKYNFFEEYDKNDQWTFDLLSDKSPIPMLRPLGRAIKKCFEVVGKNLIEEFQKRSILNAMGEFAVLIALSNYMNRTREVVIQDETEREIYLKGKVDPNWTPPKGHFPLTKGLMLQPHQCKAGHALSRNPPFAVMDIAPGGGKTITAITDILYQMKLHPGVRILVMCPGHLVKDYIREANKVTKGRLNVIAITASTIKNLIGTGGNSDPEVGFSKMEALITKAPPNTFCVTNYDFIKGGSHEVAYGTENLTVSDNAEFLRQFDFQIVYMDESHFLKNDSQRTVAAQRLISEIPQKRLLTGTFVADTILDVVKQYALFDPSVFGSQQNFIDTYAEQISGGKVVKWKDGTEQMVAKRMREYATVVSVKKREWAALLPKRNEEFHFVPLTENQRLLYDSILHETLDIIKAAQKSGKLKISNADMENQDLSDEAQAKIAALLRPYMQRLEKFLAAPTMDEAGEKFLKSPKDKISPKAVKVIEICKQHLANKIPGKILVFTSYKNSALDIYNSLPSDLKAKAIHYKASDKFKAGEEFENNPDKVIMIGVEASMNTGLNFQMASRLIRIETVWTPGNLIQGEARIDRPLFPKEFRPAIYFDWLAINQTVDVTKLSRLIAKNVSKSKVDNPTDPRYQTLAELNMPRMTIANIMLKSDAKSTMMEYLETHQSMVQFEQADWDAYRNDPKTKKEMVAVPEGDVPKDSKLMKFIPYVAGMDLYAAGDLGLVRYPAYVRENSDAPEMEIDPETGEEIEGDIDFDPTGLIIHTEMGEGECIGESAGKLRIKFANGTKGSFDKLGCFVVTKTLTSTKSIRDQLAKIAGLEPASITEMTINDPADTEDKVPSKPGKKGEKTLPPSKSDKEPPVKPKDKKPAPNTDTKKNQKFQLFFSVINNSLVLMADADDPDVVEATLKDYGFVRYPDFMFANVRNAKIMEAMIAAMTKAYHIQPKFLKVLNDLLETFNQGKSKLLNVQQASKVEMADFFRIKKKPAAANEIRPYPIIQDDELYICIDLANTPAAKTIKSKVKGPGITWEMDENVIVYFAASKPDAKDVLNQIVRDGHTISNFKTLKLEYNEIKLLKK